MKKQAIDIIRRDLGQVDLVVYSLAAPRRSADGVTYSSTLKTVGSPFTEKSIDLRTNEIVTKSVEPVSYTHLNVFTMEIRSRSVTWGDTFKDRFACVTAMAFSLGFTSGERTGSVIILSRCFILENDRSYYGLSEEHRKDTPSLTVCSDIGQI